MMNELLRQSGFVIVTWLEKHLPTLSKNWWKDQVVSRLTFQQQRLVEERHVQALAGLDFAAVLRVLDQNWNELAGAVPLPREARNWVKELQSIRNRWAHAPTGGYSSSDTFRDLDTLGRLLLVLNADTNLLDQVEKFKQSILVRLAPKSEPKVQEVNQVPVVVPAHKFVIGQLLCLKSNPTAVFPVIEVQLSGVSGETRYRVFEGGRRQLYYESQLQAFAEADDTRKVLTAAELSALLSAVQLSFPSVSSLYSLNSGRVRFVPYQYRPVFKMINADRPRLLVADEVGVGKTIEAGLILKELQARNDIKSVLIICPKALVAERKWELEMKRFDESFIPLNGALLRHCIKETHLSGEWPSQYEKAILPTSLFDNDLLFGRQGRGQARELGLLQLDPAPKFDLVIVDEAHHIRNPETFLHQAVRYFADNAEAVVFLSATPVQLGQNDLFTLLNVLRPDVIIDPSSFAQMAEPNQFINAAIQACRQGGEGWSENVRRQLRLVAGTTWGCKVLALSPNFQRVYDCLMEEGPNDGPSRIKTISALEDLYTFSSLINRTRRRDIGEFTTRKAETVTTDFTTSQKNLHDNLLSVIARILARLHGHQNVKFMMTTISRQAASSLYGLAPALQDILEGKLAQLESEDDGADIQPCDQVFIEKIRLEIQSLIQQAKCLDAQDPKADSFMRVVHDKLGMVRNKVLVFSTFRHTLQYLVDKLSTAKIRFGLVHGGIPDDVRAELRRRFSLPKEDEFALDILLSSEVGCEGLDFQFCDCLVNFDLPWNPMRIEQRIGRIDRYGQSSEAVGIFNFVTPGTVDGEIYERCLSRIGVFQHAIGGNEEILGEITRELHSIAESFSLTEDERSRRFQQLTDNKIRQMEEEQKLEERQGELFGLNIAAASWEQKLAQSRNYWLEPSALGVAITSYLNRRLGKEQEYLLGEKTLKTLRIGADGRALLLDDYRKLPRSADPVSRFWEKWLKGASPMLQVTFEQETAVQHPSAMLLALGHPLLRQAAAYLYESEPVFVKLRVFHQTLPEGIHPFGLYRWTRQGVRRDEELTPVVANEHVASALLELLPLAVHAPDLENPAESVFEELDTVHHQQWLSQLAQHSEDNRQLVGVRIQSLKASFASRKAVLEEQICRATNDKIRIMKTAELQRATVDFEFRISGLKSAAESGDIKAGQVVFGIIEIRRS